MEYREVNSGYGYVFRFDRGDDLIDTLKKWCTDHAITDGFFYGIGALEDVSIGRWNLEEKQYEFQHIPQPVELASMQGNISAMNGEQMIHAHGVIGKADGGAIAGHIQNATVAVTVEMFLHRIHGVSMERTEDPQLGLPLITFS